MKLDKYFNIFIVISLSILSIVTNTVLCKYFPILNKLLPNFILLIVIYLALFRDIYEGALVTFFITYLYTLSTPSFIGGVLLVYMIMFFLLNIVSQHIYVKDLKVVFIIVVSVFLGEKILLGLVFYFFKETSILSWVSFKNFIFELPVDLLFSVLIFRILRRLDLYTGVKKEKTNFFSGPIYLRKA
jgi:cell shape-determining protein MreD